MFPAGLKARYPGLKSGASTLLYRALKTGVCTRAKAQILFSQLCGTAKAMP